MKNVIKAYVSKDWKKMLEKEKYFFIDSRPFEGMRIKVKITIEDIKE